jgi:hypothetical protein
MKVLLTLECFTAHIKLQRAETSDLMGNPEVEMRTRKGAPVTRKQLVFDSEGKVIKDAKVKTVFVNSRNKPLKKGRRVDAIEDGEVIHPFQKSQNIIVERRMKNDEQYEIQFDNYYDILPSDPSQIPVLFMMAKNIIDEGPVVAKVVLKEGYKQHLVIITAEMDEGGRTFSLSMRTATRRVLTKDIEVELAVPAERGL